MRSPFKEWLDLGMGSNYDLCPFGKVGDRLWVRETFATAGAVSDGAIYANPAKQLFYRATDAAVARWTPSIHMPRWASRILLEITSVSVEHVQAISELEAQREGFTGRKAFRTEAWEPLYPGSWERNDWVWVIEFEIIEP